jgi:NADPH-dependent glutamate synthase beta subunit-like oxidoreductase/Pyruvate/2-oxoacid:ferredoxin oxidoreductase delta subunit
MRIDGKPAEAPSGISALNAANALGIYIPALCTHPDLPRECGKDNTAACGLCLVEVVFPSGMVELQRACTLQVAEGMALTTDSPAIRQARQSALARLLATHPHVCLSCPQRHACSRSQCSYGHPPEARCCSIFGRCELRKIADYVVISPKTPEYHCSGLPVVIDEPFYDRDYNLCIDCRRCLTACNEVRGVGCLEVKNTAGRTWVGPIAPTLLESGCKFCNACVDVCPTGALQDRTLRVAQREKGVAPCTSGCPAGIDVPRYVQFAGLGRYAEANAVVREKLPFPGILGRACFAPCETVCRRRHLDDPLSIRSLKRIAAEHDNGKWRALARQEPPSGRRVAVVGAGPAGLTVAFYLAKKGHAVTVFEAQPAAGGMARYGIPAYRLPHEVIDAEVAEVARCGVEFRFNTRVVSIDDLLQQQGFDAVFLGIGAQAARRLGIPGDDLPGVIASPEFLRGIAERGAATDLAGKHVAVIGGGNVACDDARSLLRCGATRVDLVYRRSPGEMPARAEEVAACRKEGVGLRFLTSPKRIEINSEGASLKITYARMRLDEQERDGRRRAVEIPGSEFVEEADCIVTAVGQHVELSDSFGVRNDTAGRIAVRDDNLLTSRPGVFSGGDAVLGPASLIDAVAQGRKAAAAMDVFLGGDGDIEEKLLADDWQTDPHLGREPEFNRRRRCNPPVIDLAARNHWDEVERSFSDAAARAEGLRCLKCNLPAQSAEVPQPPQQPQYRQVLDAEVVQSVTDESGVFRLFDGDGNLLLIRGVADLRGGLAEILDRAGCAFFFDCEPAHYFSQRETQLLQAYMAQHGAMPPGIAGDALDELF